MNDLEKNDLGKNAQGLRRGFTTGTCAAGAAKAATRLLLSNQKIKEVSISLPREIQISLPVASWELSQEAASCGIKKDSGDDPDITNGVLVYATVSKIEKGIEIDGGKGIGRVQKKGLNQPIGSAAINHVPRQMIAAAVLEEMEAWDYQKGICVVISIPNGEMLAKKTFNPKLGIVGGLSILGSSGIVEPMSEQALLESICLEIQVKAKNGCDYIALTPGNYGQNFLQDKLAINMDHAVKVSNFIGDSLREVVKADLKGVLLVGHIGKLVKLAGGVTQTHSKFGDCRLELLAAHGALVGASQKAICDIMGAATTEAALEILDEQGILKPTMLSLLSKIEKTVAACLQPPIEFGVAVFSSSFGLLMQSENAGQLAKRIIYKELGM